MRRTAIVISLMCMTLPAGAVQIPDNGERLITLGIVPEHKIMTLGISHSVSAHWSVAGDVRFFIGSLMTEDTEYAAHNEEFVKGSDDKETASGNSSSLTVRFWPVKPYSGVFLSAGGLFTIKGEAYGIIGAGYMMMLYDRIFATIGYEKHLGSNGQYIEIGLCINF